MFLDPTYFLLVGPGLLLAIWAQWRVKRTFSRYSEVGTRRGYTGRDIATAILEAKGIRGVRIEPAQGFLSDHYDPRSRTLRLSPDVFQGRSVAAAGVAAHEVGHAIQHAESYPFLGMRSALVPVVQVTSNIAPMMFFIGLLLAGMQVSLGVLIAQLGALLFLGLVAFQLVTLPVEFDASRRALAAIREGHLLDEREYAGARAVLGAAALTYVAGAVQSLLQFVYFALRSGLIGGRRDD